MLYFPSTRIFDSVERAIVPNAVIDAEGAALIAIMSGGVFGVQLGDVTSGRQFAGVSLASVINPSSYAYIENITVAAGATYTLSLTNLANTLYVYDVTTSTAITLGTPGSTPNTYSISGTTITFAAGQVGHTAYIAYRYTPTVQQIRAIQGDEPAGRAAMFTLGSVGVVTRGDVMTSQFDTSVNWNAANPVVTLGAGGLFTIGGTGTVVPGYVTSTPTPDSPYLGLHFSA